MSKFGGEKRYADILTVLLVIVIIGIIVLLGYFGYKAIRKNIIESDASDATEQFYNNINQSSIEDEEDNNVSPDVNLDDFNLNTTNPDNSGGSSSGRKRTYLGEYEIKGTIRIPKTGIEYPILEKSTVGALAKSVGILTISTCDEITTPVKELNVPGTNALILGHNLRNGQFFSDNDKLENGDEIQVTDYTGQTVKYTIYNMYYTSSDDISFMSRELNPNVREITLQTCNDDSSQRLIIWAKDS